MKRNNAGIPLFIIGIFMDIASVLLLLWIRSGGAAEAYWSFFTGLEFRSFIGVIFVFFIPILLFLFYLVFAVFGIGLTIMGPIIEYKSRPR